MKEIKQVVSNFSFFFFFFSIYLFTLLFLVVTPFATTVAALTTEINVTHYDNITTGFANLSYGNSVVFTLQNDIDLALGHGYTDKNFTIRSKPGHKFVMSIVTDSTTLTLTKQNSVSQIFQSIQDVVILSKVYLETPFITMLSDNSTIEYGSINFSNVIFRGFNSSSFAIQTISFAVTFKNCTFENNLSGGIIQIYGNTVSFINCLFQRNTIESNGLIYSGDPFFYPSIDYVQNTTLIITNCTFIDNYVEAAGTVISALSTALHITSSKFYNNYAFKGPGALYFSTNSPTDKLVISGSEFRNNSAYNVSVLLSHIILFLNEFTIYKLNYNIYEILSLPIH